MIPDAFGLTEHTAALTGRLARSGHVTLAPDLYYRESEPVIDYANTDKAVDRVMRTVALSEAPEERVKDDRMMGDVGAAFEALTERPEVDRARLGVVGFSTGGRLAFLLACRRPSDLGACVSFYPTHLVPSLDEAQKLEAPLLLIFAADDPELAASEVDRVRAELRYLDKPHQIQTYPGVSHGFFCDEHPAYDREAAEDAERTALSWLDRHLAT